MKYLMELQISKSGAQAATAKLIKFENMATRGGASFSFNIIGKTIGLNLRS